MEVMITIKADLMEGQTIDDVKSADVLGCENATIQFVQNLEDIAKTKSYLKRLICNTMCDIMGMPYGAMTTKDRGRENVDLRFATAYLLRRTDRFSLREIGEILGGRDHTTAIHAIKTARNRIATLDESFEPYRKAIISIEEMIKDTKFKIKK